MQNENKNLKSRIYTKFLLPYLVQRYGFIKHKISILDQYMSKIIYIWFLCLNCQNNALNHRMIYYYFEEQASK